MQISEYMPGPCFACMCLYVFGMRTGGEKHEKHVCIPNLLCLSTVSYMILNSLFFYFFLQYVGFFRTMI